MIAVLASGSHGFWSSDAGLNAPPFSIAPTGELFTDWESETSAGGAEERTPECAWWNGSFAYETHICSTFSVVRLGSAHTSKAMDRARRCAAVGNSPCVLNGEIGFAVPSLFLYDPYAVEMRMLVAPRVLKSAGAGAPVTVRMLDPEERHADKEFKFQRNVTVEYLPGGSRRVVEQAFTGLDAYCIQSLRHSISAECWASLD